jgi:uncharacterized protein (DUF58 family)
MRTSWLAGMTTRGTSFLAAGAAASIAGFLLGEKGLLCVGIALLSLPLLAAGSARRAQYRLSCTRRISPPRVSVGQTAIVTLRVENVSRLASGIMLAEDTVPYALGARPRYVLDRIERTGVRELTYPLRSDLRGRFEIGPLQLRVADSFGLVELARSFSGRSRLVVTPRVVPLASTVLSRSWAGEGDGRARLSATAGEDDVIPRAYRNGDDLRRVHWRSTARYGELMVRREEQRWRNRATILLDTRAGAHMGSGAASSFELAISAAASVGVHVTQQGLTGQLITDSEVIAGGALFEDALLDSLAVIRPSPRRDLSKAVQELRTSGAGVVIAILGRISDAEARQLAVGRTEGSQAIAFLLAVSTWADQDRPGRAQPDAGGEMAAAATGRSADAAGPCPDPADPQRTAGHGMSDAAETASAAAVLRSAGWHVVAVDAGMPLEAAWNRLPGSAERLVPPAALQGHPLAAAGELR